MFSFDINARTREQALDALASARLDVLVIGGGAAGAGVALDAAARGLRVGLVEARDWASGTSSRSSKLIHGGLRHPHQFSVPLVAEALHERRLLTSTLAPHLVTPQSFLWPLLTSEPESQGSPAPSGSTGAYDMLSFVGSQQGRTLLPQQHYSKADVGEVAPGLEPSAYRGAIRFHDARVDDARLVLAIVRTAARLGVHAVSHAPVTSLRTKDGRVTGAEVTDALTGRRVRVAADAVVNATGAWSQHVDRLAGVEPGLRLRPAKGVHLVVPKNLIDAQMGVYFRTARSVLFMLPWENYWLLGTTDTPYAGRPDEPSVTSDDVEYVLRHANSVLRRPLHRSDVLTAYAGVRTVPEANQESDEGRGPSSRRGREHVIVRPADGLVTVAGDRLTTYRVMAADTVDAVLGVQRDGSTESLTERLPLVGASGYEALVSQLPHLSRHFGWTERLGRHLLGRFGSEIERIGRLCVDNPRLARPLRHAPRYLAAEVVFAVRSEGALGLEDVLRHRIRLALAHADRGVAAAEEVAELMAPELGWSQQRVAEQVAGYRRRVEALSDIVDYPDPTPLPQRTTGGHGDAPTGSPAGEKRPTRKRPGLRLVTE